VRLIGVIDLAGGRAVHARRGVRAGYAPVGVAAGCTIGGDAIALARTYVDRLGLAELYAADLDAIAAPPRAEAPGEPSGCLTHNKLISSIAAIAPLWLDAGISSPPRARQVLALGAARAVVGLETLESFDALSAICAALGHTGVSSADPLRGIRPTIAFSLDLRDGVPIAPRLNVPSNQPGDLAARAVDAGVSAVIVLDLARIGEATGPEVDLIARVRAAAPGVTLIAGGGIRGLEDLAQLAAAGCDGALVATALHDGRLGAEDIRGLGHVSESL
jgi:phosphoribosylformimino-5-aminoimidazole carboxamide ribotide isomerase